MKIIREVVCYLFAIRVSIRHCRFNLSGFLNGNAQLEKNHVVPTAWHDEALARDGYSREVPCSALKGETVPDSLPATPKSPPTRRVPRSRCLPSRSGDPGVSGSRRRMQESR